MIKTHWMNLRIKDQILNISKKNSAFESPVCLALKLILNEAITPIYTGYGVLLTIMGGSSFAMLGDVEFFPEDLAKIRKFDSGEDSNPIEVKIQLPLNVLNRDIQENIRINENKLNP
jgi:hypothetical protein